MSLFGKNQTPGNSAPSRDWPDTLDVHDLADIAWIKDSKNPLIWHDAALACLIFCGDPHDFIAWLVEQPALDRTTAAAMFLHRGNGVRRLRGEHVAFVQMRKSQVEVMIDRLCELDRTRTLTDHGIGMQADWERARLETAVNLDTDARAPLRILERRIDLQTATMPYSDIGEGELVSQQWMRREMPYLFD